MIRQTQKAMKNWFKGREVLKRRIKKQTQKQVIEFEQVVRRGCRMYVHKETVVATVAGVGIKTETRTFSTFTNSLKELNDWLHSFAAILNLENLIEKSAISLTF